MNIRKKIFENWKLIYEFQTAKKTIEKVKQELATLWEEALCLESPHEYTVNLSDGLITAENTIVKKSIIRKKHYFTII